MKERFVHLSARLESAVSLVSSCDTSADIGCDHGRTAAALLQRNLCSRVIASDISSESLDKARNLLGHIGLAHRVSFRAGSGLSVLENGECSAVLILGMGGTLMARILDESPVPLKGAEYVVLQPMRAQADIREYLHRNLYRITDDRIVLDHGRYYQILKAYPDCVRQPVPEGWPTGFYDLGFVSYLNKEPLLKELAKQQLLCHQERMREARGSSGEQVISDKIVSLKKILAL